MVEHLGDDADAIVDAVDDDIEAAVVVIRQPPPYRPGYRVSSAKPARVTNERPWWATASREGLTARAAERRPVTEVPAGVVVQKITDEDVIARNREREAHGFGPHAEAKRHRAKLKGE